jgi:hypothetical protein
LFIQEKIGLSGILSLWILGSPYKIPIREPVGFSRTNPRPSRIQSENQSDVIWHWFGCWIFIWKMLRAANNFTPNFARMFWGSLAIAGIFLHYSKACENIIRGCSFESPNISSRCACCKHPYKIIGIPLWIYV